MAMYLLVPCTYGTTVDRQRVLVLGSESVVLLLLYSLFPLLRSSPSPGFGMNSRCVGLEHLWDWASSSAEEAGAAPARPL